MSFDHSKEQHPELTIAGNHLGGGGGGGGKIAVEHGGGSGSCHGGSMNSSPFLHWGQSEEHVFFEWWHANTVTSFWISLVILFILAMFYEWLASTRSQLERKILVRCSNNKRSSPSKRHDSARRRGTATSASTSEPCPSSLPNTNDPNSISLNITATGDEQSVDADADAAAFKTPLKTRHDQYPVIFGGRSRWKPPAFATRIGLALDLALLYGFQVFIAYFLMMVFMSFNGYFIIAILAGFFLAKLCILFFKFSQAASGNPDYAQPQESLDDSNATFETPCH